MSPVPVNYLAVLVAAVASFALGGLWYGPLFGKQWAALMGWSKEAMEAAKAQGMAKGYALTAVGSLVMAFVLSHTVIFAMAFLGSSGVWAGIMTGFWNWLGFVAPVTLGSVLWEGKSWKLWTLNNAFYIVSMCVMGVILAVWQ
jgi:uncharacterized protein DUF1761